jgi:hypothetical protein
MHITVIMVDFLTLRCASMAGAYPALGLLLLVIAWYKAVVSENA